MTVGMPSTLIPPFLAFLGISTARTGPGKYDPDDIRFHSRYRFPERSSSNCPIDTPSAPAAPPFRLTFSHASHKPEQPRPFAPLPLRYAEGSRLLRASPPACPATVLCSSRILPLGALPLAAGLPTTVSGLAFTRSVREPSSGSCCLYAGRRLGSKRVSPRLIPRQTSGLGFDAVLHLSTRPRQRTLVHRSSSRATPDAITAAPSPCR